MILTENNNSRMVQRFIILRHAGLQLTYVFGKIEGYVGLTVCEEEPLDHVSSADSHDGN